MENQSNDERSPVKGEVWTEDEITAQPIEQAENTVVAHDTVEVDAESPKSDDGKMAQAEEIKFQRIMSYKAYRRGMILWRVLITVVAAALLSLLGLYSIFLGVVGAVIAIIVGAISILVSMGNERTYTIYNTRVVIKRRGDDKRKSVPLGDIVSVKYKSAFYEKRLCVGTVTINAKSNNGKVKKFKLDHIFDAMPVVEFFNEIISGRNDNGDQGRE